jgi:hypothetical protein
MSSLYNNLSKIEVHMEKRFLLVESICTNPSREKEFNDIKKEYLF